MAQTVAELVYEALRIDLAEAFASKVDGAFRPISHREFHERVDRLALSLQAHGLRAGDRVAFLSENRPEWAIADFACALSGLISVPIYQTLNAEQTAWIVRHSGARWIICSTPYQFKKLLAYQAQLPDLETVILVDGDAPADLNFRVMKWSQLQEEGAALDSQRDEVRRWGSERKPEDLLTIIYTSGTTGDPKGVMLSHGNVATNVMQAVAVALPALRPERGDRCLSVLPLSHIFERTGGYYAMFYLGVGIFYCESLLALQPNLEEVRPTVLMAVPRIFEKVYDRVRDTATSGGFLKRMVFGWAMGICHRVVHHLYLERKPPLFLRIPWKIADRLILSKVRVRTGGRLRFSISGGAALSPGVMEFFWAVGIPIYEGYGLTETSPILTLNRQGKVRPGYVGHPIQRSWNDRPFLKLAEDGEILAYGPNIMQGYWNDEEATREMFDADGYFCTGDVGEIDPQGRVKITDRKKEIIVTNGGKNIAPQPVENLLRADPYIEQAVLIGDHRNHITALVVPHFPALRDWCSRKHLHFESDAEMVANPKVYAKLMKQVARVNTKLSNHEKVRKI
ncbi:MAG: long-chain fatty acid--CoA ligase, partial [Holophaga sp.]|nr:long-chain fatty acid--CoA ligase [Holophaga sp.]